MAVPVTLAPVKLGCLIYFLDKTTFDVVHHPLDTPEDMENFIHQELGKDI